MDMPAAEENYSVSLTASRIFRGHRQWECYFCHSMKTSACSTSAYWYFPDLETPFVCILVILVWSAVCKSGTRYKNFTLCLHEVFLFWCKLALWRCAGNSRVRSRSEFFFFFSPFLALSADRRRECRQSNEEDHPSTVSHLWKVTDVFQWFSSWKTNC